MHYHINIGDAKSAVGAPAVPKVTPAKAPSANPPRALTVKPPQMPGPQQPKPPPKPAANATTPGGNTKKPLGLSSPIKGAASAASTIAGKGVGAVERAHGLVNRVAAVGEEVNRDQSIRFRGSNDAGTAAMAAMTRGEHNHINVNTGRQWVESQHPRSHGQFAKAAGGAAKKAGSAITNLGKGLTQEDYETIHKHMTANSPLRKKVADGIIKGIPQILHNMYKEERNNVVGCVQAIKNLKSGQPVTPEQKSAMKKLAFRAVATTVGFLHGDPSGTVPHVILAFGEELLNHTMIEHGVTTAGAGVRAGISGLRHAFGGHALQPGTDGHPFRDDMSIKSADWRLLTDFLKRYAQNFASKQLPNNKMQQLLQQAKQAKTNGNGDHKNMPMFGGLAGNRLGDEGTSEGAKKGWAHRQSGGGGKELHPTYVAQQKAESERRKAASTMGSGRVMKSTGYTRAGTASVPVQSSGRTPPPAPKVGQAGTSPILSEKQRARAEKQRLRSNRDPIKSGLGSAAGEPESGRTKGKTQAERPTRIEKGPGRVWSGGPRGQRKPMTPTEVKEEVEGAKSGRNTRIPGSRKVDPETGRPLKVDTRRRLPPAQMERKAEFVTSSREHLHELQKRKKAGEQLTDQEQARLKRLLRTYGG